MESSAYSVNYIRKTLHLSQGSEYAAERLLLKEYVLLHPPLYGRIRDEVVAMKMYAFVEWKLEALLCFSLALLKK